VIFVSQIDCNNILYCLQIWSFKFILFEYFVFCCWYDSFYYCYCLLYHIYLFHICFFYHFVVIVVGIFISIFYSLKCFMLWLKYLSCVNNIEVVSIVVSRGVAGWNFLKVLSFPFNEFIQNCKWSYWNMLSISISSWIDSWLKNVRGDCLITWVVLQRWSTSWTLLWQL